MTRFPSIGFSIPHSKLAAVVAFISERRSGLAPLEISVADMTPAVGPIQVYITGAVSGPGVYEMEDGDRVIDLLNQAARRMGAQFRATF